MTYSSEHNNLSNIIDRLKTKSKKLTYISQQSALIGPGYLEQSEEIKDKIEVLREVIDQIEAAMNLLEEI